MIQLKQSRFRTPHELERTGCDRHPRRPRENAREGLVAQMQDRHQVFASAHAAPSDLGVGLCGETGLCFCDLKHRRAFLLMVRWPVSAPPIRNILPKAKV